MSNKFRDTGPSDGFLFIYEGPEGKFEFLVWEKRESRKTLIKGLPTERMMVVGGLILEPSLFSWAQRLGLGINIVEAKGIDKIKKTVLEGIFCLFTSGGDLLPFVPDFYVQFIQHKPDGV